jgi:hypothetical protein
MATGPFFYLGKVSSSRRWCPPPDSDDEDTPVQKRPAEDPPREFKRLHRRIIEDSDFENSECEDEPREDLSVMTRRSKPRVNYQIPDEDDLEDDKEYRLREAFTSGNLADFETVKHLVTEEFRRKFFAEMTFDPNVAQIPLIEALLPDESMEFWVRAKNDAMLQAIKVNNIPLVLCLIRSGIKIRARKDAFLCRAVKCRRVQILTLLKMFDDGINLTEVSRALLTKQDGFYCLRGSPIYIEFS